MSKIGKRIKEIRIKRGLSQEQLAEASKVNLRTIQRIESDETTPRGSTRRLIFDALDIEMIEPEERPLNKYLVWSAALTVLIVVSTLIGWFRFFAGFDDSGSKLYETLTGWNGSVIFGDV